MGLRQFESVTQAFKRLKPQPATPATALALAGELLSDCALATEGELAARQSAALLVPQLAKLSTTERQLLLQEVLTLSRTMLWRRIAGVDNGLRQIIALRESLFQCLKQDSGLADLDTELAAFLAERVDLGWLEHRELSWNSSAAVLEQLMAHEAVHAFTGWSDLKHRLRGSDRRCFGLFHPQIPDLPVAFVEVALTRELTGSVQSLLDTDTAPCPAAETQWAVFYAISNTLQGLRGIAFGEYLIKATVNCLRTELPHLQGFATLSPIPGFRHWLENTKPGEFPIPAKLLKQLGGSWPDKSRLSQYLNLSDTTATASVNTDAHREFLGRACLHYLQQRRDDGTALDPVARFHLGNGARLERLNYLGNSAPHGLQQSLGMMVNYRYPLEALELSSNRQTYRRGQLPAASAKLWRLSR